MGFTIHLMKIRQLLFPLALAFTFLVVLTSLGEEKEPVVSYNPEIDLTPAEEAFEKVMSVVTHKRCMNCHPSGDYPKQGEDSHLHNFGVQRGPADHGTAALQCSACHQEANNDFSGVPGAPHWGLAPRSMGWQGLAKYEIARAMLDRQKNGNRSKAEIEQHLTRDQLVLWAFEPGVNNEGVAREKPPISKEEWIEAVKTWTAAGAPVPQNQ